MISVIVPVYNAELYLEKCLESICSQTYSELEILLIDDGSADRSFELCNQYARKDNRIKVFTQKNMGVSNTRNRGIQLAEGNEIVFVDSDDYIDRNMLFHMKTLLDENQSDICFCGMTEIWPDQEVQVIPEFEFTGTAMEFAQSHFVSMHSKSLLHGIGNKLMRTELVKQVLFETDMSYFEDIKFTINILQSCKKVCVLNKGYYFYYHHTDSLSNHTHRSNLAWAEKYADSLYDYLLEYKMVESCQKQINTQFARCVLGYLKENYSDHSLDRKSKYKILKKITDYQYARDWIRNNGESIRANQLILTLLDKKLYYLVHLLCQWKFGGKHGK